MKTVSVLLLLFVVWSATAEEPLLRNPFWPQGYEGKRFPISTEPRFKPEPVKEPELIVVSNDVNKIGLPIDAKDSPVPVAKKKADPLADPVWDEAVKTLRFGSTVEFSAKGRSQTTIMINNRAYVTNDLVSANFKGQRFTWRIESLSADGKIKLKRITYRKIGANP